MNYYLVTQCFQLLLLLVRKLSCSCNCCNCVIHYIMLYSFDFLVLPQQFRKLILNCQPVGQLIIIE